MKLLPLFALSTSLTLPALAEETRELDAHEHGVGQLNIAIVGNEIAIELHAPGADIVGFEYEAESAEDKAAIETALTTLAAPLDLFVIPAAAGCSVTSASAELESEEDHDAHSDEEHEEHAHDEHKDEHAHDEHKDEHAHDEGHDDHADDEAGHTEFHAEYALTCTDASAATSIAFDYFDAFPNAQEVDVQAITDNGASAFEVTRDTPVLDLRELF